MTKAYKVVRRNDTGEMVSCVMRTVKYKKDEFVYSPNVGRLCVFDTYHHAICFCGYNEEVWECEIGKICKHSRIPQYDKHYQMLFGCEPPKECIDENGISDIYMHKLASLIKAKKKYTDYIYYHSDFPTGTLFTDKVKLLKRVYSGTKIQYPQLTVQHRTLSNNEKNLL